MSIICATPKTGVLVPIPQCPLYTATLALQNARCVIYYLHKESNWSTNSDGIREVLKKAQKEGIDVRAVVVISPGNPNGASLKAKAINAVLELAAEEKLTNIFEGELYSFKKGLRDLQESEKNKDGKFDNIKLANLHSISKGMAGECGYRGGYYVIVGFDPEVVAQIYKFVSIMIYSPGPGQCTVKMIVNPSKEGELSYPLYREEYDFIFNSLRDRAQALYKAFK
ncbi:alanine transaminase [Elasticomyces elasticus]|nr:alanine transaminase [Elasticomyces elasticus]